jgi:chromosome partitioning protein
MEFFKKGLLSVARDFKSNNIAKIARIICVASQKGGVGKTATVTNMAVGLVSLGYKTAVIDMDAQGHIAFSFGINKSELQKTIYDVLIGEAKMKEIKQHAFGVDLYLSNNSLSEFSPKVTDSFNKKQFPAPKYLLRNAVGQIKTHYDYILIDTSPSNDLLTMNSLLASSDIIIPALPEGLSVDGVTDTILLIKSIQEQGSKINILGILPTMVQDHTNLHNVMLQNLRKRFAESPDIKVFDTVIKRAIRHGLAQTQGEPDISKAPEYLTFVKEALSIA